MRILILVILCGGFLSQAYADSCSSISSPCLEYKQYVIGLSKSDLALEVSKNFGYAVGNCLKGWTVAGAQASWAGLSTDYKPNIVSTVEPCLESIGRYTHSTNYLFYETFDVYSKIKGN